MDDVRREAKLSDCGRYRYSLDRKWFKPMSYSPARVSGHPMPLIFVMLNPSTADAYADDPTIRRCIGFARREGFEWLRVVNLFAGRATKPADLFLMDDPDGPDNLREWRLVADFLERGARVVCAWGAEPKALKAAGAFLMQFGGKELFCLGTTRAGAPRHPLYLPADAPLVPFDGITARREQADG